MSNNDLVLLVIIPVIAAGVGAAIGAVMAFRYTRTIELKRDKRYVIQTLMMYRNVGAHELDWIKAINAIDIVFYDKPKVRELYHTFLAETMPPIFQNKQYIETFYRLLYEMAQCSEYKNLTMHDIRDCYAPNALLDHYPLMNRGSEPSAPSSGNLPDATG